MLASIISVDQKLITLLENARILIIELTNELSRLTSESLTKASEEEGVLLSIKQITKQFYISEPTLKKYRDQGIIKPFNKGHRPFFKEKDVLRLMQNLKPDKYPDPNYY